jgi:hypothetical protein
MNPNAYPFQPAKTNDAKAQHTMLKRAIEAPLAPILMLTDDQLKRMQIPPRIFKNNLTFTDFQAVWTAISAAEFVLE